MYWEYYKHVVLSLLCSGVTSRQSIVLFRISFRNRSVLIRPLFGKFYNYIVINVIHVVY